MFDRRHFGYWGGERMFRKGDFKYLILDLLKDKPRHGYEIIRELEERFHGFYSPSPGVVYPTLQYLEEMGYVTSKEQDGKKVYTITDEGLKHLAEEKDIIDDIRCRAWPGFGRMHEHMHEQMHGHEQGPRGHGGEKEAWESWSSEMRDQFRDAMGELRDLGRLIGRRARSMDKDKFRRIGEILKRAYEDVERIVKEEPKSPV